MTLEPCSCCKRASEKARAVLTQITKNFYNRDKHTFLRLYKQYMRPHLEFASLAWSLWHIGDIEVLERVQEKVLRMTTGLKGSTYEKDLTQVFKILKEIDKVGPEEIFMRRRVSQHTKQSANTWTLTS